MMFESVIIIGLAAFAATYMLQQTDGPFGAFEKLRNSLGIYRLPRYDSDGELVDIVEEIADTGIARLVACFWCLITWISFMFWLVAIVLGIHNLYWFASIGFAGIVHEVLNGTHD